MNREQFTARNAERWKAFEESLERLEKGQAGREETEAFPGQFRQMCSDLALARYRMYGLRLCDRLNQLIIRAYSRLHREQHRLGYRALRFFAVEFPQAFRRDWKLFWLSMALFWLPLVVMAVSIRWDPHWVQSVLSPEVMQGLETMYKEGDVRSNMREHFGSDFQMFGHYIWNNISIDLRTFAGGVLYCLGSLAIILFNGIFIGSAIGYVHYACTPGTFWPFVSGHSSFELIGAVVATMAGMRMGIGLLRPGNLPRRQAFMKSALEGVHLLFGAVTLTFIAAIVEGFWSAGPAPAMVKYVVGIFFWIVVLGYLGLAGRGARRAA